MADQLLHRRSLPGKTRKESLDPEPEGELPFHPSIESDLHDTHPSIIADRPFLDVHSLEDGHLVLRRELEGEVRDPGAEDAQLVVDRRLDDALVERHPLPGRRR